MALEDKCQIWIQNHICFPKGALLIVLLEYYPKPVATTTICVILMALAMLMYRMLECICNILELRLPCKSNYLSRQHWAGEQTARWAASWLKDQAQGWQSVEQSVEQSLGWRPGLSVLPRGQYWCNSVATSPLMMSVVVRSAPSANLLMWQVQGGADTLVGCAATLRDFSRLVKGADRNLILLTRINTKSWERVTICTSTCWGQLPGKQLCREGPGRHQVEKGYHIHPCCK